MQTWLVRKAARSLSDKLGTEVSIERVDLAFFYQLQFKRLLVRDQQRDTLFYAGAARFKADDWFFLKTKITIHEIYLSDVLLDLNRTGPEWNYAFIEERLSSGSTGKKRGGEDLQFDLRQARLENLRFRMVDGWRGEDFTASVDELTTVLGPSDLNRRHINLAKLSLESPHISMRDYTGKRPDDYVSPLSASSRTSTPDEPWLIRADRIEIRNGAYRNDRETQREPLTAGFDPLHFAFEQIKANIDSLSLHGDTLQANLQLATTERNGLAVESLNTQFLFHPSVMSFHQLDLKTARSHLRNRFDMHYDSFNRDMREFIDSVRLDAGLQDSRIHSDDIAYFAPELNGWNRTFTLSGEATGTVAQFRVTNLNLRSGQTLIQGALSMKGLPDIDKTFILFETPLSQTTYEDLRFLLPDLKQSTRLQLDRLGAVSYSGAYTGYIRNFVASGRIESQLGNLQSDIILKIPEQGLPTYSGSLSTASFDLGQLTQSKQVGQIAFSGTLDGSGFSLNDLKAKFTGKIPSLDFNGYRYRNIEANGNFEHNQFKGRLQILDSNIRVRNLNGLLTLSGDNIAFQLQADLDHLDLMKTGWINRDLTVNGAIQLDFTGNNIDNFLGSAKLDQAQLRYQGRPLSVRSMELRSELLGQEKKLSFLSDELQAELKGKFTILTLPDAFRSFLSNYYPSYISNPNQSVSDQDFEFYLRTGRFDEYLRILDPQLRGGNEARIDGHVHFNRNELSLRADIPRLQYRNQDLNHIRLNARGNRDTLFTDLSVRDIALTDSLHLPDVKLNLVSHKDLSDIQLQTRSGTTLSESNLNATVQTAADGINIHFYPSSFTFNNTTWNLDKDGELAFRKNYMHASDIRLHSGEQELVVATRLDELSDRSELVVDVRRFRAEQVLPLVFTQPSVSGIVNGQAVITDPMNLSQIRWQGEVDSLLLENEWIGHVHTNSVMQPSAGLYEFRANSTDSIHRFNISGRLDLSDSTENRFRAYLDGEKIRLSLLRPYLSDIFSDLDGTAISHLTLFGNGTDNYLTGDVMIQNGFLKVGYTQCRYFLENQKVVFGRDEINLNLIRLRDSLGHTATLNGMIRHHLFDDFEFDHVKVETAKMALLNTTASDNSDFYGSVTGSARLDIFGPLDNLVMDIEGMPSNLDSSHLYLLTTEGKESQSVDYIDFKKFGSPEPIQKSRNDSRILVNLKINAIPSCQVDVILDEETGDVIRGQGKGIINIRVGTVEPLSIRGTYALTRGEYNFNFQTFLQKPFTLNRGTISWNGDPYQAIIDIDAEYLAKNVDISSLSANSGFRLKEDIKIISHLSGSLQQPNVTFAFELPEKSEARRDDVITKRLADFRNDPNEMNKQVASLLLFNTFIIGSQNFLSQGNASTLLTNTIGGMVSGLLTNFFNRELEKATKGILSTYIDINPTLDLQRSTSQLQANVRAGLKILLDKRLVMLVGGNLDYNNPNYAQQLDRRGLLTPDINIEWIINKDGTLRVVGFNRSSIDFTLNQRNRSGLQLSYRKDVNHISDLFKSRKRIEQQETEWPETPALKPKED